MKFIDRDLEFELPTIAEFLANAPTNKIAFKPTQLQAVWGPSPKGYLTLMCESYKIFVHRNSACGQWFLENLGRIADDELTIFIQADSLDGRSFEVLEVEGSKSVWDLPAGHKPGLILVSTTPSKKKNLKSSSGAGGVSKAQEGASSLSNDR